MTMLSPECHRDAFPGGPDYEGKLRIFESAVRGWQLGIAEQLINGNNGNPLIPDSGFATLAIVASYPEMYWQYRRNESSDGRSGQAWREGIIEILQLVNSEGNRAAMDRVYRLARCGLFHDGRTRLDVLLSGEFAHAISVDEQGVVRVNPHRLTRALLDHFETYVAALRQEGEASEIGGNFSRRFDEDYRGVW
jgi:hypothetical protein